MHSSGVCHRDVSLENLMIHKDSSLRIGDFGLACEVKQGERLQEDSAVGKLKYMPPEVFATIPYDPFKGDIWASE